MSNGNGIIEPGEEVNLINFIKNIGGVDIQNLTGLLTTSSPYLLITDGIANFGDILIDSIANNSFDPFKIRASPQSPNGIDAELKLLLSYDPMNIDTILLKVLIGKKDYLVWDPDRNHSSGPIIHSILQNLGYYGDYSNAEFNSFEHLKNYKSIFICAGVAYQNYVLFRESHETKEIVNFIEGGGCIYLEGGECWYFDPLIMYGYDFNPYFMIHPLNDGSSNLGPVEGMPGTFTNLMFFDYSGENFYLDQIDSRGDGFRIFYDQDDDYYCGVASAVENRKTVGISFEIAGLVDNQNATKEILIDSIMHFFEIEHTDIEERPPTISGSGITLLTSPNPFHDRLVIQYASEITGNRKLILRIYDASGRQVKSSILPQRVSSKDEEVTWGYPLNPGYCDTGRSAKIHRVVWDGKDDQGYILPSGVYFCRLISGEITITKKVIKLQ
uniref:T9SS type A sorting domain-containing protein n=1 Tax=candidate division WOR-3 bacterium TaxID=2052148 RepID=A0A7C4XV01_UNCW3